MSVSPELILQAYRVGVFPMAESRDDPDIFWVDPKHRGVIPLDGFHISRSLARTLRQDRFDISINRDFSGVMQGCAARSETWINDEIHRVYTALQVAGHAHSLEVWHEGRLVGGVYGVAVGGAFCGESMFSDMRDASKVALAWLVDHLRRAGFVLFDTQFVTPHLASLGGQEISRAAYQALLKDALPLKTRFSETPLAASGQEVVQRNTQTS
ncbi:Leucyl/phenylalanyl-tRNA--protein transferase [Roseivivax sp. THAF40]|uniref:leucyl/phenylalanyl-tRNA--protein transferase n=1 Tax=unclassified Roseivivax TaxID=2639302 RepID=UPI00126791B7|nr:MULTISPECIES: leucyl/phenylalanyl-tRNA--protein transferase [unclassified Roseivivax]QFS83815.1 Leucyl/phenylalanyl-tRNA--protein transferase [Roseivivax sp. THAF197b]QFT47647.1 Leucyl/phenylalanyl-tRNA--protein transferase [Roseivivax sp. THAF40]